MEYLSFMLSMILIMLYYLKGALDKFNIIPNFFPKKNWDFYTIRSVSMSKAYMPSFTF